jgi:hypothetical protein
MMAETVVQPVQQLQLLETREMMAETVVQPMQQLQLLEILTEVPRRIVTDEDK